MTQIKSYWKENHSWITNYVLWPFFLTRGLLLMAGWFSQYFTPSYNYFPDDLEKTWAFSANRFLDIWARWDSGWYLNIAKNGYLVPVVSHKLVATNIAFWPLYPYLIRGLSFLVPSSVRSDQFLLGLGVMLSNLFFVLALAVIYRFVIKFFKNKQLAQLTIWYLVLYPTSFIFSSMYTESLFLFLSVTTVFFAYKQNWLATGLVGGLAAITRPPGILIFLPVLLILTQKIHWRLTNLRKPMWLIWLTPVILAAFLSYAYWLTGDFLAPITSHEAWHRGFAWPWQTFLHSATYIGYVTNLEQLVVLLFVLLAILSWWWLPKSLSSYSIILVLIPLFSGSLQSVTRIYSVLFPLFIVLAVLGKKFTKFDQAIKLTFLTIQVLFFIAWCQFYWIG